MDYQNSLSNKLLIKFMKENFESQAALLDPGKTKTIGNYVIGTSILTKVKLLEKELSEK